MVSAFDATYAVSGSTRRLVVSPAAPRTTLVLSLTIGSLLLPPNRSLAG
jgi:hypothetical protein